MANGFPIDNYQMKQIRTIIAALLITFAVVLVTGNIITALIHKPIRVDEKSYTLKNGFPLFTSQEAYVNFIKTYPYNPGVKLVVHRMMSGESFWSITKRYNITIETLIAANPHIHSLIADDVKEVVVPMDDGVLMPFDDVTDVWRMSGMLDNNGGIRGKYLPTIFMLISRDDMRLVFFRNARPVIINDSLERIYSYYNKFMAPVKGHFTSLYGDRVDPYYHDTAFHCGIDIQSPAGSPVSASCKGMVMYAGWRQGYGRTVIIQHKDGYATLYAHLSAMKVNTGDFVEKNAIIGNVGSTGRSTGPHVHFEIRRHDDPLNPLLFIW